MPCLRAVPATVSLYVTCLKLYSRFDLLPEEVVEVVMSDYNVPGVCVPE